MKVAGSATMGRLLWALLVIIMTLATLQVQAQRAVVLGRFNLATWGVRAFPDAAAMWIWSRRNANINAPINIYTTCSKTLATTSADTAVLTGLADSSCTIVVNGEAVGSVKPDWLLPRPRPLEVLTFPLYKGSNTISLRCVNQGGPAGLLLSIRSATSTKVLARSDATWTCAETPISACKEYAGYKATADSDRSNADIGYWGHNIDAAALACTANPECKAFNSLGWLKSSPVPVRSLLYGVCLYTKISTNAAAPVSIIDGTVEDGPFYWENIDQDAKRIWGVPNSNVLRYPSYMTTTFYKTISASANELTTSVFAYISVDDACNVYVNGVFVVQVSRRDITSTGINLELQEGANVISLTCWNLEIPITRQNPSNLKLAILKYDNTALARSDGSWTYTQQIGCQRPSGWCAHEGATVTNTDCDKDGKIDWTCSDTAGYYWAIMSSYNCSNSIGDVWTAFTAASSQCPVAFTGEDGRTGPASVYIHETAALEGFPDMNAKCISTDPSVDQGQGATLYKDYVVDVDFTAELYGFTDQKCLVYMNGLEMGTLNPLRTTLLFFKAGVNLLQLRCIPAGGGSSDNLACVAATISKYDVNTSRAYLYRTDDSWKAADIFALE